MEATQSQDARRSSWLDKPVQSVLTINWETVLFAAILIFAVFTRFYDLETRVMSHDESLHTYYSWRLFKGMGYEHTPLMHGPLQFHIIALSYFLFGDSDFSARIFAVVTSILTIAMMWKYRKYLGRYGALAGAILLTISPYMLYYGRYVRNESYVGLFGVVFLWGILKYIDSGDRKYLYIISASTILHFTAKETAFIYTAQALLFLGLLFVRNVTQRNWPRPDQRRLFLIILIIAFISFGIAGGFYFGGRGTSALSATDVASPVDPDQSLTTGFMTHNNLAAYFGVIGVIALIGAVIILWTGYGLANLRKERSFDLVVLLFSLVLPQLSPFIIRQVGWNPLDYSQVGLTRTAIVLVPMILLSVAIGWLWNFRLWLVNAAIFYAIFTVFYTTIFTNGLGFFTGLVGSLGYWLEQQAVKRGNQPWYYYIFLQVPVYEFLPLLGSLLALGLGIKRWGRRAVDEDLTDDEIFNLEEVETEAGQDTLESLNEDEVDAETFRPNSGKELFAPLMAFWSITSMAAYTIAGEKMPWLTYHIALPMILLTAWALGQIVEEVDWQTFKEKRGPLSLALLFVFVPALFAVLFGLLGNNPPFQGKELVQLQATSTFSIAVISMAASGWGIWHISRTWQVGQLLRVGVLAFFGILAVLTVRGAFRATYVNYDQATEYLVYAHSAGPVKEVLKQAEEISRRTSGDLSMAVAYDDDVSWPFTWYMRNFKNHRYYANTPTRDLRDVPFIVVGDNNFDRLLPVVGQAYYQFDYIRMWWPNQDYFNLTWDRIKNAFTDPEMRAALFDIWLNRDYTDYARLTNKDMSLANWSPSDRMRLYIRKDIAAEIWEFGVGPAASEIVADPYEGKGAILMPDWSFGTGGSGEGQLSAPRGLAVAPDGSIYVADSRNNRIQHFAPDGTLQNVWGRFADTASSEAPGGTFNEPWDVALDADGNVYVADTWNHRIQKFTSDGTFITMWGYFGTAEAPEAFWGPRSITIDSIGRLSVTDTGNKRIVIFDTDGNYLTQFGSVGFAPGQFDEPVGLANDAAGRLYVADTWNQRVQVISAVGEALNSWEIFGWFSNSLENKPYLDVDTENNRVYIADPESYRILEYTLDGEFLRFWGDYSTGIDGFGLVSGVAVDPEGGLWVSDGVNNRLLHFQPITGP